MRWARNAGSTERNRLTAERDSSRQVGQKGTNRPNQAKSTQIVRNTMGQVGREYANRPNRAKKVEAVQSKVGHLGQMDANRPVRAKSAQGALSIWDIRDEKTRRARKSRQGREPTRSCHVSQGEKSKVKGQVLKGQPEPMG
ncbi:hypothetical protein KI387_044126 [Taxus chinensis]|uniref:Uncharacterized protein n=1 Tax=Taxus chinensis TaxID=29808 RepID=A0AA38FEQ6_TAXCH|nr:hypothetical protein KI387_044126 [Taxus chinensis]